MINKEDMDILFSQAGELKSFRARKYFKEKRVKIVDVRDEYDGSSLIYAKVKGSGYNEYNVNIFVSDVNGGIEEFNCDCMDDSLVCKHVLATFLELENNFSSAKHMSRKNIKYKEYFDLLGSFDEDKFVEDLSDNEKVTIAPILAFDGERRYRISFKIGKTQMYKLKSLPDFCDAMKAKAKASYGKNLEFVHRKESFNEDSLPLLDFILKYGEIIGYANRNIQYNYYGKISESNVYLEPNTWDEIFDILVNKEVNSDKDYEKIIFRDETETPKFELIELNDTECKLVNLIGNCQFTEGDKYLYCWKSSSELIRYSSKNKAIEGVLEAFRKNEVDEIKFDKESLTDFLTLVLPKLGKYVILDGMSEETLEKYMPKNLGVKLFLDANNKGNIICRVSFCYGESEFNPFEEVNNSIARNKVSEKEATDFLESIGFRLYNDELVMEEEEKIYDFLTNNINKCMTKFEVLVTENLKSKQIKQPKIGSVGVKIENNLLELSLNDLDFDISEIGEIAKKYKLKKKYHRLKDGNFLSLEGNSDIDLFESLTYGADIDFKNIKFGEIRLPVYRSLYLDKLLDGVKGKPVSKNEEFKRTVREVNDIDSSYTEVPKKLENVLRFYQKNGYKWLKTLDSYGFGGILADDMGLGKTIQVISILLSYKENGEKGTSIVICPSSLTHNWYNEVMKFADEISMLIISGKANERRTLIERYRDYDLIITSYDLLKRDIDVYKDIDAKFIFSIADEAQYIKNENTKNARAIKSLNARSKYALTGTPVENSLAELWSIFDYIMPGYLFNYSKFKKNYELPIVKDNSTATLNKLKMMIEPFILRRNKKDVLTELPEKTVTVLHNDMVSEQRKIYSSYLMKTKKEITDRMEKEGFEKSKIKILALLMRLRQICCHPSLFIDNYSDGSGKLEQCMEIVREAVRSGHKILLFSSYTSMFEIIEKELNNEEIKYFKLTGATKVDERVKLVDEFNTNPEIKVFLISLKAGGTGLNLTGADIVIHYDPWWNLAAENQATDRAYRIGQKNNVQVYKLITRDSIEEKINELQEKKSKLIDDVLSTEETFINKLSKEDILNIFN